MPYFSNGKKLRNQINPAMKGMAAIHPFPLHTLFGSNQVPSHQGQPDQTFIRCLALKTSQRVSSTRKHAGHMQRAGKGKAGKKGREETGHITAKGLNCWRGGHLGKIPLCVWKRCILQCQCPYMRLSQDSFINASG